MARELNDILEDIDGLVREGLSTDGEGLHGADGSDDYKHLWRYVGITASIIPLLLEYRSGHAVSGHFEAELRTDQHRIDALWPRCLRCRQPMSWLKNSSLLLKPDTHLLRLCIECKEAGFHLSNFAECPICHRNDGCRSIGPDHWYFCDTHHTKWQIGSNLFSVWRTLTEEEWRQNAEHLADYREVRPSLWMSAEQALLEKTGDGGLNDLDPLF